MKPSFGWDLAGYGKSGSALCRADRDGDTINARVFRVPVICCPKLKIDSSIQATVEVELEMLRRFAKIGNTYLDVPVDLQLLARIMDHREDELGLYYWQLVKRPVDHVFKALAPLASNLGFAVARTSHLLGQLAGENVGLMLGENLFETYPAATLQLVRQTNKWTEAKYKGGKVIYHDGKWHAHSGKRKDEQAGNKRRKNDGLATLATTLGFRAAEDDEMTDDEFDAVICAVTGCLPDCTLSRESLATTIRNMLVNETVNTRSVATMEPPRGYAIFDHVPPGIQIQVRWINCSTADMFFAALEA